MKIIKLTESDLRQIVKKVINEQRNYVQTTPVLKMGDQGNEVRDFQQKLINLGYDLGSKGADGFFGKKTQAAVAKFQGTRFLKQTGQIDQQTRNLLGLAIVPIGLGGIKNIQAKSQKQISSPQKKQNVVTTQTPKGKTQSDTSKSVSTKFSGQVNRQLEYMIKNGLLKNQKFTILDDKNNQVHAFNPNYQLYKTFYVITGKDVGDQLKTKSMSDWVKENWSDVGAKFFSSIWSRTKNLVKTGSFTKSNVLQDVATYIDNCYFGQAEWNLKNTPSGVFKRAGNIENFMNDWLATTFIEEDYGSRFVTWETCDGKTIPFGFHGTKSVSRLKVLPGGQDFSQKQCKRRQMSFGCINFADKDVKEISNFISSGQITIWLPDTSDDIVQIPNNCIGGEQATPMTKVEKNRIENPYYMNPGKI